MEFGQLVRNHRELRGWTQSELARELGIDHSQLSRIEKGSRPPQPDLIRAIISTFGLTQQEAEELLEAAGLVFRVLVVQTDDLSEGRIRHLKEIQQQLQDLQTMVELLIQEEKGRKRPKKHRKER